MMGRVMRGKIFFASFFILFSIIPDFQIQNSGQYFLNFRYILCSTNQAFCSSLTWDHNQVMSDCFYGKQAQNLKEINARSLEASHFCMRQHLQHILFLHTIIYLDEIGYIGPKYSSFYITFQTQGFLASLASIGIKQEQAFFLTEKTLRC